MSGNALARLLFNALFLVIGVGAYALGISTGEPLTGKILSDVGLTVASSALVFFIFSWITERHQTEVTEQTVGKFLDKAVRDVFQRIGIRTMSNVWSDYRWHCWISRRLGDQDPYTRYIVQQFHYQFVHPELPPVIRVVIGYSNDNDAGKPYYADSRCFLVWEMSWLKEQPIDLSSPYSHGVNFLEIAGEKIKPKRINRSAPMAGGEAVSYEFEVPERFVGVRDRVAFSFYVRKIASADNTINVVTRMKEDCDDAEFMVHVDNDLFCSGLYVYTTETTTLVERVGNESSGVIEVGSMPRSGWARFDKIIQKGSNVRFEVRLLPPS